MRNIWRRLWETFHSYILKHIYVLSFDLKSVTMVKQSRNCNAPEGSKAPLLEEIDGTTLLENQQFEHDHPDQFQSAEKQAFEQWMLEMESLLRAVVHDNNNLRA